MSDSVGSTTITDVNGTIFFRGSDGVNGPELWSSNGTVATTGLAEDIAPGQVGSVPEGFTEFNGSIYFFASTGINGSWTFRTFEVPRVLLPQPDLMIGGKLGRLVGNNVYNRFGVGQQAKVKTFGRKRAKFFFVVQNDGNLPDTIRVAATKKNRKFKPKYISSLGGNVSAALFTGNYRLVELVEGGRVLVRAKVKPNRSILEKSSRQKFLVNARSESDAAALDVARVKLIKKGGK